MNTMQADMNGSYADYQRIIDMVRDHDEDLADTMLELVDDDPARVQYKKKLQSRANTTKKLEAAKKDISQVARLNNDEQIQFFERQMEYLIKKKNVIRDVNLTQSIVGQIYNNPITDTQNATLFFMENLYEKNQTNHRYNSLELRMNNLLYL